MARTRKVEHKLGEQIRAAQLQGNVKSGNGSKVSGDPGRLPGVYEAFMQESTASKAKAAPGKAMLPGVYELAVPQAKSPSTPGNTGLPGVYQLATGKGNGDAVKKSVLDFSKSAPFSTRRDLKLGDEGEDVRALQEQLNRWCDYSNDRYRLDEPNGKFTKDTQETLKAFQKAHGFKETGILTKDVADALKNMGRVQDSYGFMELKLKEDHVNMELAVRNSHVKSLPKLLDNPEFQGLSSKAKSLLLEEATDGKKVDRFLSLLNDPMGRFGDMLRDIAILDPSVQSSFLKSSLNPRMVEKLHNLLDTNKFLGLSPARQQNVLLDLVLGQFQPDFWRQMLLPKK